MFDPMINLLRISFLRSTMHSSSFARFEILVVQERCEAQLIGIWDTLGKIYIQLCLTYILLYPTP
jgi:hypothetical protein